MGDRAPVHLVLEDLAECSDALADLRRHITGDAGTGAGTGIGTGTGVAPALLTLVTAAPSLMVGSRWVSVTCGLDDRFHTLAASDPVAEHADRDQHLRGTGPCLDAVINEFVFASDDLAIDDRWAAFGPRVARDLGVRSVLSLRLAPAHPEDTFNASLNFYADHVHAFDDRARRVGVLLAVLASSAPIADTSREPHDRRMLDPFCDERDLKAAVGVLRQLHRLTTTQAFDLLHIAAQTTHRTVRQVAAEVVTTGERGLALVGWLRAPGRS